MPRVSGGTRLLGFAGLLPQVAAVSLMMVGLRSYGDMGGILALAGYWLVIAYGALILSFLGGIWWGFAMQRETGQGRLAAIAVVPSLVAFGVVIATASTLPQIPSPWPAIVLGSSILLTLPIDRHLSVSEEAPNGWVALRLPLSVGLGVLTIAAGFALGMGA